MTVQYWTEGFRKRGRDTEKELLTESDRKFDLQSWKESDKTEVTKSYESECVRGEREDERERERKL